MQLLVSFNTKFLLHPRNFSLCTADDASIITGGHQTYNSCCQIPIIPYMFAALDYLHCYTGVTQGALRVALGQLLKWLRLVGVRAAGYGASGSQI